jgi:hypothetical protein
MKKSTPYKHRSVSENLQNYNNKERQDNYDRQSRKSFSNPSIQAHHEHLVDARPVLQGKPRDFSAKVPYKVPNINYNTALRSSRRPNRRDHEEEELSLYRR